MATVGDVMSTKLLTVEATTSLTQAARDMHERSVGAVLVLTRRPRIGDPHRA